MSVYTTRYRYVTAAGDVREYTSQRRVNTVQRQKLEDADVDAFLRKVSSGTPSQQAAKDLRVAHTRIVAKTLAYAAARLVPPDEAHPHGAADILEQGEGPLEAAGAPATPERIAQPPPQV